MAMMITKFHKLIRNKLLWIGFLVMVVFSFVIWGTQMPDAADRGPSKAGTLGGEDISIEEYQRARFNTYLSLVLMSGRPFPITPEVEEELHNMTWQRIASLREADRLGLSSSNDEVVNAIRSFEFLQSEGRFSPQAYEQFAQQFLAQFRATKREFEEHVRQEIVLQKLRTVMDRVMLVTPLEVDRTFSTLTDSFGIEYVTLGPEMVADTVELSEEDIIAFFNKDPEAFTLPEQVRVKAAVFAVADFIDEVEVSDAEIEEYYDFNLDRYALPSEMEDTNIFSRATTEYRPLEEVKDDIRAILQKQQAALRAIDKANAFVQELSFQRGEGRAAFDKLAAAEGVEIIVTAPFSAREWPPELEEASLGLTRAAFNLTDDDDYYYSDPIAGTNFVYVLGLLNRELERVPDFEEVREQAERSARDFAIYNALLEKAQEVQGSAVAGLSAGLSFDEVLAEYTLAAVKPDPFTMNTVELDPEIASAMIRHILVRNQGEVTDVIEWENGVLIAYVKTRTPDAEASIEVLRPQIIGTLRRQIAPAVFSDMQQYLLKRGNFEDFLRRPRPVDGDEDDRDA